MVNAIQTASWLAGQPASRPAGQPASRPAGQPAGRPAGLADGPGLNTPNRPVQASFGPDSTLGQKCPPGQKLGFSSEADIRFTGTSWVRAHGLIFGKVYIVWVCAPAYRPLPCRRNHIRENRLLIFDPIFVATFWLRFCSRFVQENKPGPNTRPCRLGARPKLPVYQEEI